jgi:sigma-B regulation protein RsbU (phosphoserine phosphatase)
MTDFEISKKKQNFSDKKKHLTGSLALRLFFISFILLVIPLFLHSLFMYRDEYTHREKDVFISLKVLGENRVLLIDQMMDYQKKLLDTLVIDEKINNKLLSGSFDDDLNAYFKEVSQRTGFSEVFFLSFTPENKFIVQASSLNEQIKNDYTDNKLFLNAINERNSIFLSDEKTSHEKSIFVTKTIFSPDTNEAKGLLVSTVFASNFIVKLASMDDSPYPLDLSILNKDSSVFVTSNALFKEKLISEDASSDFYLFPLEKIFGGYLLKDKKNTFFSVLFPLKNTNFFLLADVNSKYVVSLQKKAYFYRIATLFFFILVIGGVLSLFLIFRLSKPLRSLYDVMKKVAVGDMQARFKKDKMGFEINLIGSFFNKMIESVISNQKEAETQRLQKRALYQELKIGHDIQKSMFPAHDIEFPGVDIAHGFLPAKEVGGDFYDLFLRKDNIDDELVISIADTAGKGVPACLYSLSVRSMLRSFAKSAADLNEIIVKTNNLFCLDTEMSGVFVTSWTAIYDNKSKKLEYNSCGHYPALLRKKDGSIQELNVSGMALGVDPFEKVEVKSVLIDQGDSLFLYTDGVIESTNEKGEFYGKDRVKIFLEKAKGMPSKYFMKSFLQELKHFSKNTSQYDDITMLFINFL